MRATRSGTRSATAVTTTPPKLYPTSTTSRRSSNSSTLTTSRTCVSSPTSGEPKCTRSPTPVSVGVNTSFPASRSRRAVGWKYHPPDHIPCTITMVATARLSPGLDSDLAQLAPLVEAPLRLSDHLHVVEAGDLLQHGRRHQQLREVEGIQ